MDQNEKLSEQLDKKPLGFEKKLGIILAVILVVAAAAIGSKYIDGTPVMAQGSVQAVQPAQPAAPAQQSFSAPQQ